MINGPYFPLFCTVDTTVETVNQVVQAAYDEQNADSRLRNLWVLIKSHDQQIFPMPTPLLTRFPSDFVGCDVDELGAFCKSRFTHTGLICNEDFGVMDSRTLEDNTLLFARWEQYTPEDDAILRLVWGDANPKDEAWLSASDLIPEDRALLRKLSGKATPQDDALLKKQKHAAIGHGHPLADDLTQEADLGASPQPPDFNLNGLPDKSPVSTKQKASALEELPAQSPRVAGSSQAAFELEQERSGANIEIKEGWRSIRIPIATAMRDTGLVFRQSITDLLKIRSLFDDNGILRY